MGFDHDLYVEGYVVPHPQLQRMGEISDYIKSYNQVGVRVGYQLKLGEKYLPQWLSGSGLQVALGFSYTGGNDINLGSHRYQGEVLVGWRQAFFQGNPYVSPYLEVMAGLAPAANFLDFGKGVSLQGEASLNGLVQVNLGLQRCFTPSFCPALFSGYFYDGSFWTGGDLEAHQSHGWLIGIRAGGPLKKGDAEKEKAKPGVVVKFVEKVVEKVVERPVSLPVDPPVETMALKDPFKFARGPKGWEIKPEPVRSGAEVIGYVEPQLHAVARAINQQKHRVKIHGWSSRTGGPANQIRVLSLARAMAVYEYLTQVAGVSADKLLVEGEFVEWKTGRPVKINFRDIDNLKILDARGGSVHGDGRLYGLEEGDPSRYESLPFSDPKDDANACVTFEVMKP